MYISKILIDPELQVMFQIQCLESTKIKTTELFSKFRIETLAKGQATTLGNALRRTLLSNILGVAIIGVRISNIDNPSYLSVSPLKSLIRQEREKKKKYSNDEQHGEYYQQPQRKR